MHSQQVGNILCCLLFSFHVGFVVEEVTFGQVFLKYFSFPIPPMLQTHASITYHQQSSTDGIDK